MESKALWRRIICSKYRIDKGNWWPSTSHISRCSKLWKDIVSGTEQSSRLLEFYLENCKVKVGNGHRVNFWVDKWYDNLCLKDEFPLLYRLVVNKGESLFAMVERRDESGEWCFQFKRELYNWERVEAARLVSQLGAGPTLSPSSANTLVWDASNLEIFPLNLVINLWQLVLAASDQ